MTISSSGSGHSDPLNVWILAGQSNMQGIAPLDDPRRDPSPAPGVEVLGSDGRWTDATEPLHRLWESYTPVQQLIERAGLAGDSVGLSDEALARRISETGIGAGLGPAFASRYAEVTRRRVGLIPCAHGGTTLEQWGPGFGGADIRSTETLYGAMLDRVSRARERPDVVVSGMLWYQGESDATPSRSIDYAERLGKWIASVRADLSERDLPVVVVQLGRFTGAVDPGDLTERSWNRIREAQRTLIRQLGSVGVVSAVDLGLSDPIHIGAPGLARLGRRMAMLAAEESTGPDVAGVEYVGPGSNAHLVLRVRCTGVRGGWRDAGHFPGFALCEPDGTPIGRLSIVDAHPDPADRSSILVVTAPLDPMELAGVHLAYGQGFDPFCVAVDEEDLPLPAFGPQPVVGLS